MTTAVQGEYRVPKGTVIFRQGDRGGEMFVISEGCVRLTLGSGGNEKEIAVLRKGDFFGELSLLSGAARSATAEAIEDSVLLPIGRDAFQMMLQDDLAIVSRMFSIQGQRLSDTNQPIEELMQRLGRIRIIADCLRRASIAESQPLTVPVAELVATLRISANEVEPTLTDLAAHGAGTFADHQWCIHGTEQTQKLITVLCRYAEAGRD